jgi:hypothetical protein
VNRTEYFIALAVSAAIFDLKEISGTAAFIHIAFMAMLAVCWLNAVRKERKP